MNDKSIKTTKIAVAAILVTVAIGYVSYTIFVTQSQKSPNWKTSAAESISATSIPQTIEQEHTVPVVATEIKATMETSPTRQAEFVPSESAKEIMQYRQQASVQSARLAALKAQKDADEVDKKIKNDAIPQPIAALLGTTPTKPKEPSILDLIVVKSLVESGGEIIGTVAVAGELINVKRGSKIGNVTVVGIRPDAITFSDGHTTKTRRIKNY
ncbi:hypothetical protein J3L11_14670 [Shewanella sp. 4t3-1-2LB]|uniref:hypothetical protein n=1 Tax=Shewanella sp. 4t3-1-2LB TaxID=2817682 RepID=UPI001A995DA1|nr:hypothetical protein [Shewanella sp. 4t3-1-2LB]MBO1272888.1 hypothetical protein [Shewanella sp. 4t3-1-2LB]